MATYKKRGYKPKGKGDEPGNVTDSATAEVFSTLDTSASKTEQWVARNQTYILGVIGVVAVGVLAFLGYQQFIQEPREASASNELFYPLQYFSQAQQNNTQADSLYTLALQGAEGKYGLLDIVDEYSGTKAANLARYAAGISYMNLNQYQDAISYLEDFKSTAIIWYIVWLVGLLAGRVIIVFRRRKQKATEAATEPSSTDAPAKTAKPITTDNLLRFLFVVYCFLALEFSLFVSGLDFSSAINIILLTVGIVFFIIASTSLLKAHKSEGRPLTDLLWIMLYPFPAYAAMFFTIDIGNNLFWAFPGYFYFLSITGGFVLGIVFSPILAKRKATEREKDNIDRTVRDGIGKAKASGALRSIAILLTGAFVAVAYFFTRFLSGMAELTILQMGIFCFFLLLAVAGVVKFTVRHTRFGRSAKGRG